MLQLQEGLVEKDSEFDDFRQRAYELIKDVMYVVGTDECFAQLHMLLAPLLEGSGSFANVNGGSGDNDRPGWEHVEACLFIMSAVAKHISSYVFLPISP